MLKSSGELLMLTGTAAALIQRGRICFANSAARDILGDDCVGKSAAKLLGPDIAGVQASSFVGDLSLRGLRYIVRVSRMESEAAVFFSRPEIPDTMLNDAFMYSLRGALMGLGLSLDTLRGLADGRKDEALQRQLALMSRNYYSLYRIISNATVVRAKKDNSLAATVGEFDLAELLRGLSESVELLRDGPRIKLAAPEATPVTGDEGLIRQMLMNLLSNCYLHAHGCTRISLSLMDCGDRVMLSVDDDGCGVAADRLHTVFDRFCHGYDMKTMGGGAGLGLTAARAVAELHGGALLLESREGRGTTVRASINKLTRPATTLHAAQEPKADSMTEILIGLADCLPAESFSGKYLD